MLVISSVHMDKESLEESLKLVGYDNEELFAYLQQKALGNPLIEVKINKEFDERAVKEKTVVYKPDKDDPMDTASAMDQVSEEVPALDTFLLEQIYANMRDTPLRDLVLFLVAFINPEGYVTINLNEAAEQKGVEPIEMLDALTLLHQLDPPGVGARNLQECLMLQTERDEYAPEIAYYVLENFFTAFSDKNWQEIADEMAVDLADVKSVFEYVQSLDPTPGSAFGDDNLFLPRPDLYLQLLDGHLTVKYNE
ncbi:MAG: RNA polymerase factor sigma-54, partial [Trichococcus flocculiformis]